MDGDFLRKKIELSGFQLFEVANNLGITQQHLQSKLKTSDVKVSFLEDLALAINKNVYYFFEDKEKTKCEENCNKKNVTKNVTEIVTKPNVKKSVTTEIISLQKEVQDLKERLQDSKDHITTLKEQVKDLREQRDKWEHQYNLAQSEIRKLKNVQDTGHSQTLVG